jgi:serine/threonine protein kinase
MGNNLTYGEDAYNIKLSKANKLGEGSFANVYKIERKHDRQICAAKIFKKSIKNMLQNEEKSS